MLRDLIDFFRESDAERKADKWIFGTILVAGILSLLASFVLSIESINLAKNPEANLSCSISAVINCASVMKHPSAELLGFPNSFIGIATSAIVMTVGAAGLLGVRFTRPFMALAQIGFGFGLLFAFYLTYTSVFIIQILCPWCLLVVLSTTIMFSALLRYNIREDNLYLSEKVSTRLKGWIGKDYDKLVTAALIFGLILLVLLKYRDGLFA